MSDISIISGMGGLSWGGAPGVRFDPAGVESAPAARPSDRVELSDRARLLSKLHSLPAVRQELVDRARRLIEDGSYDTPSEEVLDRTASGLIQDLDILA